MNRGVAVVLMLLGIAEYEWPGFNGFFFASANVSVGEGRIIWAILTVGAAIVWFIPPAQKP